MMPAMSHRDRVLMEKERRREEAQRREELELRKIRESNSKSNRAHQRMRAHERKDHASSKKWGAGSPGATSAGDRSAATTHDRERNDRRRPSKCIGSPSQSRARSKSKDHSSAERWRADPFDSRRGNAIHSPRQAAENPRERRRGRKSTSDPSPPQAMYGEPMPPHQAPRNGTHYSWRSSEMPFRGAQPARQPMHSVCLEALDAPERGTSDRERGGSQNWWSEDSYSSDSLSEVDEWDGSTSAAGGYTVNEQRKSGLQQRIDQCRAAICRHKMTIAMLQYSEAAQEQEGGPCNERPRLESFYPGSGDEGGGSSALHPVLASSQYPHGGFPGAPAFVQDFTTRLQRRCLEGLGMEKFRVARRCLRSALDAAEVPGIVRSQMLDLLGVDKIGFLSLLDQLVHMERRWGTQEAV